MTPTNKKKYYNNKPFTTLMHRVSSWEGKKLYDILSPICGYIERYSLDTKWEYLFNSIPKDIPRLLDEQDMCFSKERAMLYTEYVKKDKLREWNKGIDEWDKTSFINYG